MLPYPLRTLALLGALSAAAPACSDDSTLTPDAPVDPAAALLGTWRAVPSALSLDPPLEPAARRHLTFAADGSLTLRTADGSRTYDYLVNGDRTITATRRDGGAPRVETFSYRVDGDHYLDNTLTPMGPVTGPVGTWTGVTMLDGDRLDKTWELRADQTALLSFTRTGVGSWSFPATWRVSGDDVRVIVRLDEVTTDVVYVTLRDGALGTSYEAVP